MPSRVEVSSQRAVSVAMGAAVLVFGYGALVHVAQSLGRLSGRDPYVGVPPWLELFFYSLTILDPIVVALLLTRPAVGWVAGCAVLLCDSLANGIANYPPIDDAGGVTAGRVGHAVVSLLAVLMLISVKFVRNTLSARQRAVEPTGRG